MGGVDFGEGLHTVAAMLGIEDLEMLMWRLLTIKSHDPKRDDDSF